MSRVVMYVYNDVRTDARVLREAISLVAAGHAVTVIGRPSDITATTGDTEHRDGFAIVRVPIPARWRFGWTLARYPWRMRRWVVGRVNRGVRSLPGGIGDIGIGLAVGAVAAAWSVIRAPFYGVGRAARRRPPAGGSLADWLVRWQFAVRGWAHAAAEAAPVADVHHGHDLTALPAAVAAADRDRALVVYDSHEIFLASGSNASRPRWARAILSRLERRWVRRAAALVTVNESLAMELTRRYRPARVVIVHNCPPRWEPPTEDAAPIDLLRTAAAIPEHAPVALYHGAFSLHRGIEQLAAALLEPGMGDVHAVALGYGGQRAMVDELASDPRFGGRFHVLPAVAPDKVLSLIASADVGVMPIQPSTLNHRLSTPNKLFECLAAGVPVVVSDFPEMRRIVRDDPDGPLGETCDPTDPADVARAIRAVVDRPDEARAEQRRRCLRAAHARWNWESESARLVALYAELAG